MARTSVSQVMQSGLEARPGVTLRLASAADKELWDGFVMSHATASFYHRFGWRQIVQSCFRHDTHYLLALEHGTVAGILPLVLLSTPIFGRILCSVPFLNYGGPCARSSDLADLLVAEAVSMAEQLEVDYLELRCASALATEAPVSLRKVSLTLMLDPDPDVVWNGLASKHRKNIRRAYKYGLDVRTGGSELLSDFFRVLERSWRDLGTPLYRRAYFESILESFSAETRIFSCRHAGEPVSVALVGQQGMTVEGMWQGGTPASRALQANYVLYWEMIRYFCRIGCREFHLGRSTAESGSEQFKKKWNAESRQLYWYFFRPDGGQIQALNVENPRYRLAIAAWRRLPIPVVRLLGPHLARGIP